MNVFYYWMQGLSKVPLICVFESVPALSVHARACFRRGEDHGFHRSPKRAFDPRAAKKHSIIKRFNGFGSLLFPPGGANLL